jgi:hypothetical protein
MNCLRSKFRPGLSESLFTFRRLYGSREGMGIKKAAAARKSTLPG